MSDKQSENRIICPICGASLKNQATFSSHLSRKKDNEHIQFRASLKARKELQKQKDKEVLAALKDAAERKATRKFQKGLNNLSSATYSSQYSSLQEIKCKDCSICCYDCHKTWTEYFDACDKQEKHLFEQTADSLSVQFKVAEEDKLSVHANEAEEPKYLYIEEKIKKHKKVSARDIIAWYYNKFNVETYHINWPVEIHRINNLLNRKDNPVPAELLCNALQLYFERGGRSLIRFRNSIVDDTHELLQYRDEINKKGSIPRLINFYCKKLNLPLKNINLLSYVRKIKQVQFDQNLSYEDIKTIIKYMVDNDETNIFFIGNIAPKALQFKPMQEEIQEIDYYKNGLDSLKNANITVKEFLQLYVDEKHTKEQAKKDIISILKERTFSSKLEPLVWCWKVKFPFGKRTFLEAKNNSHNIDLKDEQLYFEKWLNKWNEKFS